MAISLSMQEKELGVLRPSAGGFENIYTPPIGKDAIIRWMGCSNATASNSLRMVVDEDGTTYDESTALFWDYDIGSSGFRTNLWVPVPNGANVAVSDGTIGTITFALHGLEMPLNHWYYEPKQIAQSRPSGTGSVDVYTPPIGKRALVRYINICNTTTSAATATIYHDNDGSSFISGTKIFDDESVSAKDSLREMLFLAVDNGGHLGVKSQTGSALTFSIYGHEIPL